VQSIKGTKVTVVVQVPLVFLTNYLHKRFHNSMVCYPFPREAEFKPMSSRDSSTTYSQGITYMDNSQLCAAQLLDGLCCFKRRIGLREVNRDFLVKLGN
jgi:hypothetical protein